MVCWPSRVTPWKSCRSFRVSGALIGSAFKRTAAQKTNTEILLFITPHILDEGTEPPILAKEREQIPLTTREERSLEGQRQRVLKERAIVETIDSIVR